MGVNFPTVASLAVVTAAMLASPPAFAQWNNEPYQFRGNAGGNAGMSMAYRQAVINQELFGRRPENLLKGADGRLLEVFERDQQAFVAEPEPNFVVRRSGYGIGGTGFYLSAGGLGLGAATIGGWTGMLSGPINAYAANRPAASPIDAWVGMLD